MDRLDANSPRHTPTCSRGAAPDAGPLKSKGSHLRLVGRAREFEAASCKLKQRLRCCAAFAQAWR